MCVLRRLVLWLVVVMVMVAMVVLAGSLALADQSSSCKGLENAFQKSGNEKVIDNAKEHDCKVGPPPPKVDPA